MSLLEKVVAAVGEVDELGELVALLRNSQLPTVVVEKSSDMRIYSRWVEQRLLGTYRLDVLAAGGRINLLRLYERRSEFAHLPVVFIANKGMWLFSGIPKDYSDIICTQGYSIENDVYSMGGVENLLDPARAWEHWLVRESIIRWFAFEVEESIAGMLPEVTLSLDDLVSKDGIELDKDFCKHRGFCWPGTQTTEEISYEYRFNLPGKLLFEMLARFSSIPLHGLYNIALANYEAAPGPGRLIEKIKEKLDKQRFASFEEVLSDQKTGNPILSVQHVRDSVRSLNKKTIVNEPYFSADELIANLKVYTPTVIVEREVDSRFDWWIERLEERLKSRSVNQLDEAPDVLSIVGRDEFLSTYERRNEFLDVPVAFVGNREMWLFVRIPVDYEDIVWTQGYSLENDLYADTALERLLEPHETWKHRQVRNSVIEWFAFEVEEFLAGRPAKMDFELSDVVLQGQLELDERFCQHRGFQQPPVERVQQIKEEPVRRLPGKFIFQILARSLNIRGRDFDFKVTERGLYDIALTMHDSQPLLNSLIQEIEKKLDGEEERIGARSIIFQQRKRDNQNERRVKPRRATRQQRKPKSKQNQAWTSQNTQPSRPSQLMGKLRVKLGDKVSAMILKKDGIKVTVQLQTDYKEEVIFEYPYYQGKVGNKVKLKVIDIDGTGRVREVVP